jgi:hypothetical protein
MFLLFMGALAAINLPGKSLAQTAPAPAAPPQPQWYEGIKLSGFVDGYYSFNFNRPDSNTNTYNGGASNFDFYHNAFSLSMAELDIIKDPSPVGFRVDLDYGPTTDFVTCGAINCNGINAPDGAFRNVQQAYVTWATPLKVNIDYGKFVTHMGAEVIESKDNWNYTRSLLFAYAIPYYGAGARANYAISDSLFVNGYVLNGWNNVVENNNMKTFGAEIGWTPTPKLPIVLNWIGPEECTTTSGTCLVSAIGPYSNKQVFDGIVTFNMTDSISFMVNYDYGTLKDANDDTQKYSGAAFYARWKVDPYALAVRYEKLVDNAGIMVGVPNDHLSEVTVTGEKTISGNLLTRLEYRYDKATKDIFEVQDVANAKDHDNRLILSAVYMF